MSTLQQEEQQQTRSGTQGNADVYSNVKHTLFKSAQSSGPRQGLQHDTTRHTEGEEPEKSLLSKIPNILR